MESIPQILYQAGGSIADIWSVQLYEMQSPIFSLAYQIRRRGSRTALFVFSALFGTAFGPLSMGPVVTALGWRWVQWLQVRHIHKNVALCKCIYFR